MVGKKKRILFLTTIFPYPLDGGGKIRAFNNLKALSKEYEIDLVSFNESKVDKKHLIEMQKYCSEIRVIEKIFSNNSSKLITIKNILKSIIKNSPFIIEKFNDKKCSSILKNLLKEFDYEAIFFEHLSISCYKHLFDKNIKQILSQQNCEYILMKRRYENEKSLLKKIYIYYEYKKLKEYELKICNKFNNIIMLSEEDKGALISDGYKKDNISIIPIGVNNNIKRKTQYTKNGVKNLLFIGTLTWYPNEQGILWFIDNVWKDLKVKYTDMNLYIIGKNPNDKIMNRKSNNGVIVTGYVEDIDEYIEKCDVCIVPLFIGGGMRVKILESMARGVPCISTKVGAEGIEIIENKNILIANTKEEFIEALGYMNSNSNMYMEIVENGIKLIDEKYSVEVIEKNIIELVSNYNED